MCKLILINPQYLVKIKDCIFFFLIILFLHAGDLRLSRSLAVLEGVMDDEPSEWRGCDEVLGRSRSQAVYLCKVELSVVVLHPV